MTGENKINNLGLYMNFVVFCYGVNVPIGLLRSFYNINLISEYLLLLLIGNIFFVLTNFSNIRHTRVTFILLLLVLFTLPIGILENGFSRRTASDLLKPLIFILIMLVFSNSNKFDLEVIKNKIKQIAYILLAFSFVSIIFTQILLHSTNRGNIGITPPIDLSFSYFLVTNNPFGILTSVALIFLSGKRALMIGSLLLIAINFLKVNIKSLLILISLIALTLFTIELSADYLEDNTALKKYRYTIEGFEAFFSSGSSRLETLDKFTGGRIIEAKSALKNFNEINIIFGKGVGYTYTYIIDNYFYDEGRGNVHISPISLFIYYGLFFTILFYYLIISLFSFAYKNKSKSWLLAMSFQITLLLFITSFFAFNFFISPLWPFFLGIIYAYKRNTENFI